jgi:hypothetical protein
MTVDKGKEVYTRPVLTRHKELKDLTAVNGTILGCTRT